MAVLLTFGIAQCTSDAESSYEKAKFALDAEDYTTAVSAATSALNEEPSNAKFARLLANAYFGRGGFNTHEIAIVLLDINDTTESNYRALAPALPEDGDLGDLKLAIETLEGLDGINETTLATDDLKDAAYDLGVMEIVYHYAIAIYRSNYKAEPLNYDATALDDSLDDDDFSDLAEAKAALVNFDNHMVAAGFDPEDDNGSFIKQIRKTHCLLKGASADDDNGYSLTIFQALVQCDLSAHPENEHPEAIDAAFTDCGLADPDDADLADSTVACYDEDTSLD